MKKKKKKKNQRRQNQKYHVLIPSPCLLTGLLRELPKIPWPHLRNDGWETTARVEIALSKIAGEQCFSSSFGCPCGSGQIV